MSYSPIDLGRARLLGKNPAPAGVRDVWTLRYTAPPGGVDPGGTVRLVLFGRTRWSMFQDEDPAAVELAGVDDHSAYDAQGRPYYGTGLNPCTFVGATARVPVSLSVRNSMMFREALAFLPEGLPAGESLDIALGAAEGDGVGALPPRVTCSVDFDVHVDLHGGEAFAKLPDSPRLRLQAGPPARLKLVVPSDVRVGERFDVHVVAFDAIGNPCDEHRDVLMLEGSDAEIRMRGGCATTEATLHGPGVHWLTASSTTVAGLAGRSNPVKATDEAPAAPIRWGDPHGHTYLCDGRESPDDFYAYARDVEHLDFSAVTGHDDCTVDRNYWILPQSPYWRNPQDPWAITKYAANRFHEPGRFVAFVAFEWSGSDEMTPTGARRFGDRNVYFPGDDGEIFPNFDDRYDAPAKLWEAASRYGALVVPHHPGYAREGTIWGCDWDFHDDDAEPLVEIYSKHGCSESMDGPRPLPRMSPEGVVQTALGRGYRLGFVGGSDTHVSRPGSDVPEEDSATQAYTQAGLTAVRCPDLTRLGLLEALRSRDCYATTGERIWLAFSLNGRRMGSEVAVEAGAPLRLKAEVYGTDVLERLEIVRDGRVAFAGSSPSLAAELSFEDSAPGGGRSSYYYLRVTQANGSMAWSSPIWVDALSSRDGAPKASQRSRT